MLFLKNVFDTQKLLSFPKNFLNHMYTSQLKRLFSAANEEVPDMHSWTVEVDGNISCKGSYAEGSGVVLGVYDTEDSNIVCLTKTATVFNDNIRNKLVDALKTGPLPKLGEVRVFPKMDPTFDLVVATGLGENEVGYSKQEERDEAKENIRKAVGAAVRHLQHLKMNKIYVEGFNDPESAAEGAHLAVWENQHLRLPRNREVKMPEIVLYGDCDMKKWRIGLEKAEAQNIARKLTETPANLLTPRALAYTVVQSLVKTNVNVTLRGERWLHENHMMGILENSKGSPQSPILVELSYNGCDPAFPPIVLIGKGLTFNSGGLCLKSCEEMRHMRGDMAGAAAVVAAFKAIATLGLPINVAGILTLGENMPGASAGKPLDIIRNTSGNTILVSPKDFNGNLMLADAICYANKFNPKYIVTVATLTKEIQLAFHLASAGLFTKNEKLWQLFKIASIHSGDRVWKCPLWKMYEREVKGCQHAALSTFQAAQYFPRGISCTSAAFLNQFVCQDNFAHIDTYGITYENGRTPYLKEGMSGRPTRTLIEFLGQVAYPPNLSKMNASEQECFT